jgi:hypothetical protein
LNEKQSETITTPCDSRQSSHEDEISYTKDFRNLKVIWFDVFINTPLQEMFPLAKYLCEHAIYVRDEAYNFPVAPEMIKIVDKDRFYRKGEKYHLNI